MSFSILNYEFTSPQNIISIIKFNRNNTIIICGFMNGIIQHWNRIDKNKPSTCKLYGLRSTVLSLDIDYNDEYIIGSDVYGSILMWKLNKSIPIVEYEGHNSAVYVLKFSPITYYFASGSHDTTIQLWCTNNLHSLRIFTGHISEISCLEWCNNGIYVISGDNTGTIRMWDVIKGYLYIIL